MKTANLNELATSLSVGDLERLLALKQKAAEKNAGRIARLNERRDKLSGQINEIDTKIAALEGADAPAPKARKEGKGKPKAKTGPKPKVEPKAAGRKSGAPTIADLAKSFLAGQDEQQAGLSEIAAHVVQTRTGKAEYGGSEYTAISTACRNCPDIVKVVRGVYRLKAGATVDATEVGDASAAEDTAPKADKPSRPKRRKTASRKTKTKAEATEGGSEASEGGSEASEGDSAKPKRKKRKKGKVAKAGPVAGNGKVTDQAFEYLTGRKSKSATVDSLVAKVLGADVEARKVAGFKMALGRDSRFAREGDKVSLAG